MRKTTGARMVWSASMIVSVAGGAVSVWGQTTAAQTDGAPASVQSEKQAASQPPAAPAGPPEATTNAAAKPVRISFNFKETPFGMVLDFFARESGLPIIREAAVPAASMTFIGASSYSLDEALSILNLNLAMHGVQLRRQDQFLYLATLQDSAKKPGAVATGNVPADARPEQYLTLTIPLDNANATVVAEQIKTLVGPYGGVTAVPQQNLVIVMETAAQCRRIREVVQAIDVKQVDTAFKVFPLKFAQADAVFGALRGLLGERVKQTFVDKDGKQTTVQDISVAGLNLQPDARTNSIIAVGSASRIRTAEELVALLDAPDGGSDGTQMTTFTLAVALPAAAAEKLNGLFATVPANRKPTVLPLTESGKITVVGSRAMIAQAAALLSEIDPGAGIGVGAGTGFGQGNSLNSDNRASVIRLSHIPATQVEQIAGRLLTPRQLVIVKFAATPDGKGIIVSGPAEEVASFEQLVKGLDVPSTSDKEVRVARIATGDPAAVLKRAQDLYLATGKSEREPVIATLDGPSRSVTLIGSKAGLTAFDALLTSAQANATFDLESRTFQLVKVKPSELAPRLARLAKPMLTPEDGSAYHEPTFEPLDELGTLIVRGERAQMPVIDQLVKRLDAEIAAGKELRVVQVASANPVSVIDRAQKLYADRTKGMSEAEAGVVSAEFDPSSRNVIVSGKPAAMKMFAEAMTQAQQLMPPPRATRVVEVVNVQAKDIVGSLTELLKGLSAGDAGQRWSEPVIQSIDRTNSLLVTAEESQHAMIADFVKRLDQVDRTTLPPLKLVQVKSADAATIAGMLTKQYSGRAPAERASKPVDISADASTNTLIVSAPEPLLAEIRAFVEDLNKEKKDGPERVTQLFPLKVAKAIDVAAAMDKLYPLPPVPVDRQNRPMPWLQKAKEITVSAEASSNSLIIDAPADRQESLKALAAQLDRVELPPAARLRTYRIIGADLKSIAQTLQGLSRQGTLSGPGQPGKPPVNVLIESEPKSSTLIVAGDEVTFERVEAILKDLQAVPIEKGLRVVPIANAKALDVRARAMEIYSAQIKQIPGANAVDVTIDEGTNSLMVVGDVEGTQRFVKVLDELQRQTGPAREIRMIELRNAKVGEVIAFLADLMRSSKSMQIGGGPDPVFEPIEATNSLLVAAQPAQFVVIDALVRSLDNQRSVERPPMRILNVRTTDAANLATVLQSSYDRRGIEQKNKQPVEIQADPATNTLIVSAHADLLPEIQQIIEQLNDQQSVDSDGREIRIFPLKIARAEELAKTIDQMFPEPPVPRDPRTGQPRPDLQRPREIVVRADRGTNSLIVDAPAKRLNGFEQIVKNLDQQKLAENVELKTYRVNRAELAAVATTIKNLAATGAIYGPGQSAGAGTPVTVDTEPTTRTLIVSGPTVIFAQVEKVLKQLDGQPDVPTTGIKMYSLKHARAERLQPLLERLLTTRLREQQVTDGNAVVDIKSLLEVASDAASNTLIVSAPESVQRIAEELVKSLDTDAADAGRSMIRVIPLSFGDASQMTQTIAQMIPTMELPSGTKPLVTAAPGANALVLSGADADLNKIEEVVKSLDIRPSEAGSPKVETFELKHTDATVLAQTVQRLLTDQQDTDPRMLQLKLQYARQARQDLFKAPTVRVEVDARVNSLIVSAPAATLELAKQLIERLDRPAVAGERAALTYTPAKSDPVSLAATVLKIVNATVPQGRTPLELVAEIKSGSILAIGTPEQVAEAVKKLREYDDRAIALPRVHLEVVSLKHADASSVSTTVQSLLADRSRWPEELRRAERAGLGIPQPTVNADAKSNRLLMSVPTELLAMARELIQVLDQPGMAETVEVRVFSLRKGSAASVAAALKGGLEGSVKPGEPKPSVTAEPSSNSVIVSGSPSQLERAAELIRPMDDSVEPAGVGVRTIFLKHARAEAVAPVLEGVLTRESPLDGIPGWAKVEYMSRSGNKTPEKARVSAERRLNAVVVSGPASMLELAEQVITQLDVDPTTVGGITQRSVRIITLRNADASELAASVESIFAEEKAVEQPPTVRVDKASNSLIVRASDGQMKSIESLTSHLDSATLSASRQMRMVPVDRSRVDAALMARTLKRLLEQQGGVKVEVITTDELLKKTKGSPEGDDAEGVKKKASHTNAGHAPGRVAAISPPPNSVAPISQLLYFSIAMLEQPRVAELSSQPLAPPPIEANDDEDSGVTIAVDRASNSILIVGSPRMTDRLAALAAELEKQMPAEASIIRVVTLPDGSDARQIAEVVNQTARQIGRKGPDNPGGFAGAISILPDPAGSALIVLASPSDFDTVGPLIAAVSQVDIAKKVTVKIYPLASVTARRAADAIADLLSAAPRGQQAQRVRRLDVTVAGDHGEMVNGIVDGSQVRVTADPGGASIIVTAPAETMPLLDRFVALIDQSPVQNRLSIRRYELKNAQSAELSKTLQMLMDAQRQGPTAQDLPQARFVSDERTNSMLVTASDPQHAEVQRLLAAADAPSDDHDLELAIITLQQATPSTVQRIVDDVLVGRDPGRKSKVRISAQDGSSVLVVRASKDDLAQVRALIAQIDTAETSGLPVRSVKLERADAGTVAAALQKFFSERAQVSSRPGQKVANRVAIAGEKRSGTLVVAASDEDFEQVKALAATFDKPAESRDMQFRVITLKNARVNDVRPTLSNIADQLQWERSTGQRGNADGADERLMIEPNERTNSLVVMGSADAIATVERVIVALDTPEGEMTKLTVRTLAVVNADLAAVKQVVERAMLTPGWRTWRGPDPDAVTIEIDRKRKAVLVVGKVERVEQAIGYIKDLDAVGTASGQQVQSIALRHARAGRAAQSLQQFFSERARALNLNEIPVSVIGSTDGNVLMVSADAENAKLIQDLVAQIDQADVGKDRRFEIYYLTNSGVQETATTLRSMFSRPGNAGDEQVIVTPQPSTNSLIVSAPNEAFEQVNALVKQLDRPPGPESANMVTVTLASARATEIAASLKQALPTNVKVTITPIGRSNSLVLTGSAEAIKFVVDQINTLDKEPVKSLFAFRRIRLENAMADDAYFTVNQMLRSRSRGEPGQSGGQQQASVDYTTTDNTLTISAPQDQIDEIEQMVKALDVKDSTARRTEFVKLQFADAKQTGKALEVFYGRNAPEAASPAARSVTIIPDPASDSLVISGDAKEWEGIRALLTKLDTKDYDTSRQLTVIRLTHADAASVARSLNEGFRAPLEDQARQQLISQQRNNGGNNGRDRSDDRFVGPTVLVDTEGRPAVSAEPLTNSLVVFAAPRDLERIRAIVVQLDLPGFANLPEARVIPLTGTAKPSVLASAIREMFLLGPTGQRTGGPRSVVVLGDDTSGALIVRADDAQFAQIRALAETLQQKGELTRMSPEVVKLKHVPASRLRQTLLATFTPLAQQMGETLAIEVDRGSNTLVVMSSPRMRGELVKVIAELDVPAFVEREGAAGQATQLGQSVLIVDIVNNAPEDIKKALDDMGLSKPQAADRPGVVSEPVTIVAMTTRRALAILSNPGDSRAVSELVKALDAEPINSEQKVAVIALRKASATPLIDTLKAMLKPGEQSSQTGPARALAEHVRRLSIAGNGVGSVDLKLDLTAPIRLIPDNETNSVVIASTASNVATLTEIIKTLDTLPMGEAVVVRLFPLQNAAAIRIKGVVEELFKQGEALRRLPGTKRQGLPTTTTGLALAGEIAVSVDERTNLLIVAGREEAVAFVEVLVKDLDSDETSKWIEPAILPLKFADAVPLAQKLRQVLVQGTATAPEAIGLQKQYGRLRLAEIAKGFDGTSAGGVPDASTKPNGGKGDSKNGPGSGMIEADLFAPVTGLVISPEEQSNSLIVVGTLANIAVVKQLVLMLDIEKASGSNSVRPFPLRHASADRVAGVVQDIFKQREAVGSSRIEDRIIVSPDARTNSLIVSTSPRSFAILESLLNTLDSEESNSSVGLHVIPVTNADVKQLAPRIEKLMKERIDAGLRAGSLKSAADAFSVEAEPVNNLLIIASSEENFQVVKEVIAALTADAARLAGAGRNDIIQLVRVPAEEAVASLKQMYVEKENARRGPDAVSVLANVRLNSIVVGGTEQDISEVRKIVAQLDSAEIKTIRKIERIELKSANALELVRLLENVLAGRPISGTNSGLGGRQATKIQFFRENLVKQVAGEIGRPPTEADVDGVIRDQVTLTPDLRSNSIVVAAPPQMCALVREIVEDLDSTSAGSRKIEKYHLLNADARQMAELLRDTFDLRQQGSSYVLLPAQSQEKPKPDQAGDAPSGLEGVNVTAVPDERQRLSIAIDARTNTLIVSGTEEYLSLVHKLIADLDSIEATERERTVYHLRNAKAKEIETTLQKYFKGDADVQRTTLGPGLSGSLMRQLEQEVTVIGDDKSNKLVISTSPRFTETVLKIVKELDSAPPQVMIQVLLAEVTIDSDDTWGVDMKFGPFGGQRLTYGSLGGGPGVATALGVPNLSVSATDFSLLIRALEVQGKLEVLSNPQLLVSNNQQGKIQVGEDIAVVNNIERLTTGTTRSDIRRQDVGIILNVTPSINADGFVRMDIRPEISSLSSKTTQISQDFFASVITKRTLDTIVTVKDGQSVVIGGLIQTSEQERVSKVPFLGDIPVLGWPFVTKQKSNVKTELLVVLTPRIVPGAAIDGQSDQMVDRINRITEQEINRLEDSSKVRDYIRQLDLPTGTPPSLIAAPRMPGQAPGLNPANEGPESDPTAPSGPRGEVVFPPPVTTKVSTSAAALEQARRELERLNQQADRPR